MHVCVHMRVFVHACGCVHAHVHVYVHAYACVHTCAQCRFHMCKCMHTRVHIGMHVHTRVHTRAYAYTCACTCVCACVCGCVCVHMHCMCIHMGVGGRVSLQGPAPESHSLGCALAGDKTSERWVCTRLTHRGGTPSLSDAWQGSKGTLSPAARPGAQEAGVSGWGGRQAHPSVPLRVQSSTRVGGWPGPRMPVRTATATQRTCKGGGGVTDSDLIWRGTRTRFKTVSGAGWRWSSAGG